MNGTALCARVIVMEPNRPDEILSLIERIEGCINMFLFDVPHQSHSDHGY